MTVVAIDYLIKGTSLKADGVVYRSVFGGGRGPRLLWGSGRGPLSAISVGNGEAVRAVSVRRAPRDSDSILDTTITITRFFCTIDNISLLYIFFNLFYF